MSTITLGLASLRGVLRSWILVDWRCEYVSFSFNVCEAFQAIRDYIRFAYEAVRDKLMANQLHLNEKDARSPVKPVITSIGQSQQMANPNEYQIRRVEHPCSARKPAHISTLRILPPSSGNFILMNMGPESCRVEVSFPLAF